MADGAKTYDYETVASAFNQAADDVIEAANLPDEGCRDAINLVTNAALTYLKTPDADLDDVAAGCYDEDLETILDWIR